MSMFSDIADEGHAKRLVKVLNAALATNNKEVIEFCKKEVLPLLDYALSDIGSVPGSDKVEKAYNA